MRTRHSVVLTALAVITAPMLALTACAPSVPGARSGDRPSGGATNLSAPAKKSGKLTMLTKFAAPEYAPYFTWVVKQYEKQNPGVTIDLQQVGDQPYKDKIRVLASAKQLPDIYFSWAGDFAGKFVRAGMAQDLSSQLAPGTPWGDSLAAPAVNAFASDGKYYGVPIDLDAKYLAHNKTAFDKAGISAPPSSLEDLISACPKLKKAGYTPIAFGNQYGWPAIHYLTQLNAYDVPAATIAADDKPATGRFTDPGYVTALQQFSELSKACFNTGANGLSHDVAQANLTSGKAAMQYVEIVEFPNLSKKNLPAQWRQNWSFFRLPAPRQAAGDPTAVAGAPDGFMINSQSRNAALAVDFLKFMTAKPQAEQMTEQISWLSPTKDSLGAGASPQLTAGLKDIQSTKTFAIWLDTATHADVASAYLAGTEALLNGTKTPQAVMTDVRKAAENAKKQVG